MKSYKSILLKKINNGYSLIELIVAIAIGTLILSTILIGAFTLRNGFIRVKKESVTIYDISKFANIIIKDGLNPDLHPHHPLLTSEDSTDDGYVLKDNQIIFFANLEKIEYKLSDVTSDGLIIIRGEDVSNYPFIKDFNINYYDKKGFEIIGVDINDFPDCCLLNFTFYDKKTRSIKMKL
jgi:prepilin-type N-terminal cleavage/methylation domain-containing protein